MAELTEVEKEIIARFNEFLGQFGTLKELSEMTGLSSPLLSRHSSGASRNLSPKTLRALCTDAKMNLYWYFFGWGDMFRKEGNEEYVMSKNQMESLKSLGNLLSNLPEQIENNTKIVGTASKDD